MKLNNFIITKKKNLKYILSFIVLFQISHFNLCNAQYSGEPNDRVVKNLYKWKHIKQDIAGFEAYSYVDSSWEDVGVPHCFNDMDSFTNVKCGGASDEGKPYSVLTMWEGIGWYRCHFTLNSAYASRKVFIEFEQASEAALVYINGNYLTGNSAVTNNIGNPEDITHIGGHIPFVVDITDYVYFSGIDNVIAVRLDNGRTLYDRIPGEKHWTGGGFGGLTGRVWLYLTNEVHVPLNVYSVVEQWGTYIAAYNISGSEATVRVQTNVQNESLSNKNITLITKVTDADDNVVLDMENTQNIIAGTTYMLDQHDIISSPTLWYPNTSAYGGPYLYKVYSIVKEGGTTLDVFEGTLGVRKITWDSNFPYINDQQHYLWGSGWRYDYPALGTAVPDEQLWRDLKLLKDGGGRFLRPGHSAPSPSVSTRQNTRAAGAARATFSTSSTLSTANRRMPSA